MGGETRLIRQRERGRLNARERIAALFDPGSFSEIGQLVGANEDPPSRATRSWRVPAALRAGLRWPAPRT